MITPSLERQRQGPLECIVNLKMEGGRFSSVTMQRGGRSASGGFDWGEGGV